MMILRGIQTGSGLRPRPPRAGYGLIEITMAAWVLGITMLIMVKLVTWSGVERREMERRSWAIQEVLNLMERLSTVDYESLTEAHARSLAQKQDVQSTLPGAVWGFDIKQETDALTPAKRVSIRLQWTSHSGGRDSPVRLTSWIYRGRKP